MNSDDLKQLALTYFGKKRYAVHSEMALNKRASLRADVLAINMRHEVIIVEVKSSVADFKSDTKWPKYLELSNKLYFCMTDIVYGKVKKHIPKGIGVLVADTTSKAKMRGHFYLEGRSTRRDLASSIVLDLTTRMMFRGSIYQRYLIKSNLL
jgi:hypothetical protein